MAEQKTVTVSRSDIESVAEKMEQLGQQLSTNEQLVINWLLERAASAEAEGDGDVKGYLGSPSFGGGGTSIGQLPSAGGLRTGAFSDTFKTSLGLGGTTGSWQNKAGGVGIGVIW
ncbi:MAG: hypothetical protein ACRDJE_12765 [Dehalococcoidia bacterium]